MPPRPSVDSVSARVFELAPGATAWPTVALFLAAALLQLACARAGLSGSLPWPFAVLLCSCAAYTQFTVLHDAVHRSASRWLPLNEALGFFAALALFGPFDAFRRNHLHHHAHTNDPVEDPDFWVAGSPRILGTVLRCLTMLEYHYLCYFTQLARRDGGWFRSVLTGACIAGAFVWAALSGRLEALVLYWFLPAQLGVMALAFMFDYWPHRPHRVRGRMKDTAAIVPAYLDALFLAQNLHLIHHLFPTIPWYRYRAAFRRLEPGLRAEDALLWDMRTALAMLPPSLSMRPSP
ncbi:MAG: fatty acid desaturase [Elusimicrobiota bacterium]